MPRRSAAVGYVLRFNDCAPLPTGWDWAAKSLEVQAPDPHAWAQSKQRPVKREMETDTQKDLPELPSHPSLGVEVVATDGPLLLDTSLPQAGNAQNASPSKGLDTARPVTAHSKMGYSKGIAPNLFLGDHWRGFRRPKPEGDVPSPGKNKGSPGAQSSWFSRRNNWN